MHEEIYIVASIIIKHKNSLLMKYKKIIIISVHIYVYKMLIK